MNRARLSDKLLAIVMLATGLLCFARLYFALSGEDLPPAACLNPWASRCPSHDWRFFWRQA